MPIGKRLTRDDFKGLIDKKKKKQAAKQKRREEIARKIKLKKGNGRRASSNGTIKQA